MLESEYDLLGYSVLKMHDDKGRIKYGKYTLDMYDGPIYVEELRESDKNGGKITFTLGDFGSKIDPVHIPIKDHIN